MPDFQNFKKAYEREIETRPRNKLTIFVLIFFLNLATFGYTVIYTGLGAISAKKAKIEDFKQVAMNLDGNYDKVASYRRYINSKDDELTILRTAVPSMLGSADYLTLINDASNKTDYVIEKWELDNTDPSEVLITLTVKGPQVLFKDFISTLEDLERLTLVESIKAEPSNDEVGVLEAVIIVKIFVS